MAYAREVTFPDRFTIAAEFCDAKFGAVEDAADLSIEQKLKLYALRQQAEEGDCNAAAPYRWNVTDRAKYDAWYQLRGVSKFEAMVFYVQAMEEVVGSDWIETQLEKKAVPVSSPPPTTATATDDPIDSDQVEVLRNEIRRLRDVLVSRAAAVEPVDQGERRASGGPSTLSAPQPPPVHPPVKPVFHAPETRTTAAQQEGKPSSDDMGKVYYQRRNLGWLEWLGLASGSTGQGDPRLPL